MNFARNFNGTLAIFDNNKFSYSISESFLVPIDFYTKHGMCAFESSFNFCKDILKYSYKLAIQFKRKHIINKKILNQMHLALICNNFINIVVFVSNIFF